MSKLDQTIATIGKIFTENQKADFSSEIPGAGSYQVQLEKGNDFSVCFNSYHNTGQSIAFDIEKKEPTLLMVFMLKGESKFSTHRKVARLPQQHHILNFFPQFKSNLIIDKGKSVQEVVIKTRLDFIRDYLEEQSNLAIMNKIRKMQLVNSLPNSLKMDGAILHILHNLKNCPYQGKLREMHLESQVKNLLAHQIWLYERVPSVENTKISSTDQEKLYAVKEHLDRHFKDDLNLTRICRLFGLNEFKLKTGFRQLFETSVIRYLENRRMEYAIDMLRDTNITIYDLSEQLGYNHYNNFSLAFKRKFSVSPGQVRGGKLVA